MDPITIITTVGFAIQSTYQITSYLHGFVQGTMQVDETVQGLIEEVVSLRNCMNSIESCLQSPVLKYAKKGDGDAQELLKSLDEALRNCRGTLTKLNTTLERAIGKHVPGGGLLRRAHTNWSVRSRMPDISDYRTQVNTHASAMQLALGTITLYTSIRGPEVVISSLSPKIDRLISLLDSSDPRSVALLRKSAKGVISSAQTVINSHTVAGGSMAGDEDLDQAKRMGIAQWTKETKRPSLRPGDLHSFDFIPEDQEEELELFQVLVQKGQQHFRADDLAEAEKNYRAALQAAARTNLIHSSTLEHNDANLQLASILIKQEKYTDAKEFLTQLLSKAVLDLPDTGIDQQTQATHMLAKVHFELDELDNAEFHCKKAMTARGKNPGKDSYEYHESADLRGQIWDKKGDPTKADGFRMMKAALIEEEDRIGSMSEEKISLRLDIMSIDSSTTNGTDKRLSLNQSSRSSEIPASFSPSVFSATFSGPTLTTLSHTHRLSDGSILLSPVVSPPKQWTLETILANPQYLVPSASKSESSEVVTARMIMRVLQRLLASPYDFKANTDIKTKDFDPQATLRKAIVSGDLEVVWVFLHRFWEIQGFWEYHRKKWKNNPTKRRITWHHGDKIDPAYQDEVRKTERGTSEKTHLTLLDYALSSQADPRKRRDIVDILLHYGVSVNTPCSFPLTWAVSEEHYEVVDILLHHGATPDHHRDGGHSALYMVASRGRLGGEEVAYQLIDRGANTNFMIGFGKENFLCRVASLGWSRVVRILVARNPSLDLEFVSSSGTALCIASAKGFLDIVKTLLDAGAAFDSAPQGSTPLCLAAKSGHVGVVHALLEKGANVNLRSADGMSAYDLAARKPHQPVMMVLKACGATL